MGGFFNHITVGVLNWVLNNVERNKGEDYTRVLTLSLARIDVIKYLCMK